MGVGLETPQKEQKLGGKGSVKLHFNLSRDGAEKSTETKQR